MFFDSAYTALSLFLPMHFDILICLGILMFDFILFGNLWTAWISVDVSINKLEIFLALISSSNISSLCSLLFFFFQKFTMQILFFWMLSHRYIFLKLLNTLPFFVFCFDSFIYLSLKHTESIPQLQSFFPWAPLLCFSVHLECSSGQYFIIKVFLYFCFLF